MDPKDFKNGKPGKLIKGTQGFWAFVPDTDLCDINQILLDNFPISWFD